MQKDRFFQGGSVPKIVALVCDYYQDLELWYPILRMKEAGIEVLIAGLSHPAIYQGKHGYPCETEIDVKNVKVDAIDGILIPGGRAPDQLRVTPAVLSLVKECDRDRKMIAFICHGGLVPADANILSGKKVTGTSSIKEDLIKAKATFEDKEVVIDGHLISSRTPKDLPAFGKAITEYLC
ncbi:MAG: type 1 glutamine amidotransferase [Simkaniaceae bacterium]|nr:type 1 glutamine amidotransferase [Simkaniaceae bacterium]